MSRTMLSRRDALGTLAAATVLAGCGTARPPAPQAGTPPAPAPAVPDGVPPIVFAHGNGDSAAVWITTLWRFESNGWPRERLHAIDLPYPLARDDDAVPQPGRSSSTEHMRFLAAEVERVLARTGQRQVVLVGASRGGYAIRNYVAHGGGLGKVTHAVLGGTPNHGVWADARNRPTNEFNGAGPFLARLNSPRDANGNEVPPGVQWMTIRSDVNDKYAQPDGAWINAPGVPTQVTTDGPALRGAENIVLAGVDHRETAFGPAAFQAMFRFLTGRAANPSIRPESRVVLDGKVSGLGPDNDPARGTFPTNLPLAGATVEVWATNPATGERVGSALHQKTVGADGLWGPFEARPGLTYEFVVRAAGYATTHVYRSPFPRSSSLVHLRPERIADADRDAKSVVTLTRPRGYFGLPRDQIGLDGRMPPGGIEPGVPGVAAAKLKVLDAAHRAVPGEFNGERLVGRAWPTADNHLVFLELTY